MEVITKEERERYIKWMYSEVRGIDAKIRVYVVKCSAEEIRDDVLIEYRDMIHYLQSVRRYVMDGIKLIEVI